MPVNATSPNPVRNYELTDTIASFFGRRARLCAARPALLRLGLGRGAADEVLLASQKVLPHKLDEAGFVHAYGELAGALAAAIGPRRSR